LSLVVSVEVVVEEEVSMVEAEVVEEEVSIEEEWVVEEEVAMVEERLCLVVLSL